jgi:peptidyl-prolyl cis-trans isomerase C
VGGRRLYPEPELDHFMTLSTTIRLPIVAVALAGGLALFPLAGPAAAQDGQSAAPAASGAAAASDGGAEGADEVFATVDGEPITAGELLVVAEDYARQLGAAPENVPLGELLNVLIDMRLLAKAAEEAGFGDDETVERRIAFARTRVLRDAYLRDQALKAVTDESVRAQYDKEIADFEPQDEVHLRHILVETEDEGKEIIADIEAGGDFAEIAKEKSKDPGSAPNGGDLDFVTRGVTVPEFEEAAFALEVGEMTDAPVQSQFGWHVIKLEDKRESSPPELAAEETRIRNEMLREFVTERIAELRAAADVEIVEPETPADGEAGASDAGGAPSDGGEAAPANGGSSQ